LKRIGVILGTRPEAVKLAPVIQRLERSRKLKPMVIHTAQHGDMVEPILRDFGIREFHNLRVMRARQNLWELSGRLVTRLGKFLKEHPVEAVLVQGDTSSAFFGALCGYYHQIPVGHVEAGLRTGNIYGPFPEEINRKLIGSIARWHFAPTAEAARTLRREGVAQKSIYVTGNTVVDALRWMTGQRRSGAARRQNSDGRLVLVTCHRRENLGAPMVEIAEAVGVLARRHPEVTVLVPLHPNPEVRRSLEPVLKSLPNVKLCKPLRYKDFLGCLQRAYLVLSDSGGVQEEATALGKPVLVLREETERPEGVRAGALKLVGHDGKRIVREAERLLSDAKAYARMSRGSEVFGDGRAAERIVQILEAAQDFAWHKAMTRRIDDESPANWVSLAAWKKQLKAGK
jgi:UDP-N-acetylglucosamine 2-epimerase (non-hydrolysing)